MKLKGLKEKRAEFYQQIEELRLLADGRSMSADETLKWNKLNADYNEADQRVGQEEAFLDIEKRQSLTPKQNTNNQSTENRSVNEAYSKAFRSYIASGSDGVSIEEREAVKTATGITGLDGQILVPNEMASSIEKALKSYGGMLEAGSIINTTNGGDLIIPTINDTTSKAKTLGAYKKTEQDTKTFGSITLKAYTFRTPQIPISLELLQDSAFNIEQVIIDLLTDSFGRGLNEDLTIGDGIEKPTGIITQAHPSTAIPSATSITFDDILDLMKGLSSAYGQQAKFMFNTNTLYSLMKIKDADGKNIWSQSISETIPARIYGKTYIINDDIPDIGAGAASVLYGDLSKYKIRVVKGFTVLRQNEALMEYLAIGLLGFARYDGQLIDAGTHPVHKLVHAAS